MLLLSVLVWWVRIQSVRTRSLEAGQPMRFHPRGEASRVRRPRRRTCAREARCRNYGDERGVRSSCCAAFRLAGYGQPGVPIDFELLSVSREFQVGEPRGRNAVLCPAMDSGDRRLQHPGNSRRAAERFDDLSCEGVHNLKDAIIARDMQPLLCDDCEIISRGASRDCDCNACVSVTVCS